MTDATCPKCSKRMEEGFIVDHSHAINMQAEWVEGTPRKSFWTGVSIRGRRRLPVVTYCCPACGYLESYARLDADAD